MRLFAFLSIFLWAILSNVFGVIATDNGKTTDVTWDKYSLSVKGERVFIFSGEFHYQRLPVPELWFDVFQKLRANGFNAISSKFSPFLQLQKHQVVCVPTSKVAGIYSHCPVCS